MIVITGMHRSGTSLVSQFLFEAGYQFGSVDDFYPADKWNAPGYFEAKPILDLNSMLITGIPRTRSRLHTALSQGIYMTMPAVKRIHRRGLRHRRDIAETAEKYEGLFVKDPRFCLTLPLWARHTRIEKIVVCIRHPMNVAASLKRRQHVPYSLSFKFWNYHVDSVLRNFPGDRTCFINVDELVDQGGLENLRAVIRFLDGSEQSAEPNDLFERVFRRDLIRNAPRQSLILPSSTRLTWEAVQRSANTWNQQIQPGRRDNGSDLRSNE